MYSHHHVQHTLKYSHTAHSCRFYPYRQPLTHLHCSNYTIIPMPMKQPWRIWVLSYRNPAERINQIKQNTTKSCAYFTGYTASHGYNSDGTNYCSLGILRKKLTAFFFQIVLKIAGNNTHRPECWSRTLTGSEFAHHCAWIWPRRSNTYNVIFSP